MGTSEPLYRFKKIRCFSQQTFYEMTHDDRNLGDFTVHSCVSGKGHSQFVLLGLFASSFSVFSLYFSFFSMQKNILCLVFLVVLTSAERYSFFMNEDVSYVQNEQGQRFMQLDTGNRPDLNATTDTCVLLGTRMQCSVSTRVTAVDDTFTDLDLTVNCGFDDQIAFDFRRAQSCTCSASAISSDPDKPPKRCPCEVCPDGYGQSPVSIDCGAEEDPFVIGSCTNLDCNFGCNGTCNFSCENPLPECAGLCEAAGAPTFAPTGMGLDNGASSAITLSRRYRLVMLGVVSLAGLLV